MGTSEQRDMSHNVAQFCHCSAQGKVGSGFDVSAAFYGSQRYARFAANLLNPLLEAAAAGSGSNPAHALTPVSLLASLSPGHPDWAKLEAFRYHN
jgi:phosphomevalonate kinase